MDPQKSWHFAMTGYRAELERLLAQYPGGDILELGAGRWPSYRSDELTTKIGTYTVNDISQGELDHLPAGYHSARFDVCGDASAFAGRFDFVFSRFLAEHVSSGAAMHRNVFEVLKPGGVAFHLIPTLYASPFVINKFVPERLTRFALKTITPRRAISPKFPARYSMCRGNSARMRQKFHNIGYSKVVIRNFFGHFYYEKVPPLDWLQNMVAEVGARNDWAALSSYAYITAYK